MKGEDAPPKGLEEAARIIIADDHGLVRSGLRLMLEDEQDLEVVGEAENGRKALELCRSLRPDLVLMDVRMPDMDGLEATREIKRELPRTSVIIVTMQENTDYLFEALKAGAAGYLLKRASPDELLSTVRKVLGGESLLNPELATQLLRQLLADEDEARPRPLSGFAGRHADLPFEPLTPREVEVLQLVAQGYANKQIAQMLAISAGTIKMHVQKIIAKLEVSDRTQAVVRAIELGLIAPVSGSDDR